MDSQEVKRRSLPSLTMNKFFVSKRASMFEVCEETPREKRDRSPCGMLEASERKLKARKDKEKKELMASRRKRQADPYAEESTELEDEDSLGIVFEGKKIEKNKQESKVCGHANRSVNFTLVKRYLKNSLPIGECVHCRKAKILFTIGPSEDNETDTTDVPVIWLCAFCGYQGCDRYSQGKHAFHHYKTPRSDPHCLVINTTTWTVWCYECDTEVVHTSSKKLHEIIQYVKRLSEMAPRRSFMQQLSVARPTNLTTQFSGSDSRLHARTSYEEISKNAKNQKNANAMASLPKVKGVSNLGNTCFFNSVIQSLAQTHFLTQLFDVQMQSGQRMSLPGRPPDEDKNMKILKNAENSRFPNCSNQEESDDDLDDDDTIELKPLDLFLPEGGSLSLAFCVFLKDMHSVGKNGPINPGHLFGQICKKSTQFQGYEQQDAHELLRCMLEAVKNEEIFRAKRAILKAFALSEKTDPNSVNSRLKRIIKGYGKQATHTIIDQIFGGQLISTVFCEECHWSSQVFEPFMDLSLPINEEKGRPKKNNSLEDDAFLDCFGRSHPFNGHSAHGAAISKYQLKKMKKDEKKKNKKNKGRSSSLGQLTTACIRINVEDKDVDKGRGDKRRIRLTEKRRPEDEEEFRLKEEAEKKLREEQRLTLGKKKCESSKFRQLMQARSANKKRPSDEGSGGSEQDEESDEELEYDQEDDEEEDDSIGFSKKSRRELEEKKKANNIANNNVNNKCTNLNQRKDESEEEEDSDEEEEEDEEEEDEEEEEEEEETETDESESDVSSSVQNSKIKGTSKETSDADVEDNTDSEYMQNSCCNNTRHPSIVVDSSNEAVIYNSSEDFTTGYDHRYLMTSNSGDQLNYNSCSDTSERYFTAAGADTNDDDLDPPVRSRKNSPKVSKAKDGCDERKNGRKVCIDPHRMEEMCLKVGELKFRHKSSSRESLLESNPRSNRKRGSSETLLNFNNNEKFTDDEVHNNKKTRTIRKIKQEWIAKSLTTLVPRYQCERQECSVLSCLTNYTAPELLTGNNKISCENCTRLRPQNGTEAEGTVKSNASKQLLILSPPSILTLHLKRFHQVGCNLAKVNRHVQFPLILDIASFTSSISLGLSYMARGQTQVLYGLYAVVEHSGRLNSGHYVAYVRSRPYDSSRTNKQLLNTKPSSHFEINTLINEMADKLEFERDFLSRYHRYNQNPFQPENIENLEEEVRSSRWYHVSDTYVSEVTIDKVLKAQAYLLFYERIL